MSTLKQMVPVSVKTTVKSLPGIKTWFERKKPMERYDAIVNEVYNPQLIQRVEDVHIAEIEINRNCNINCVMCNTSLSTRPQFNMDMELFEHAVKYTKDQWGGHTALHTIGEPLMNKNLPQYFDILRKNGVKIHLSTNALILHKHLDLIIDYSDIIYEFRFSIDGASKERPGGLLHRADMNLYQAKHDGRNCVRDHSDESDAPLRRRGELKS